MPGYIGREKHKICARLIAFEIFVPDSTLQVDRSYCCLSSSAAFRFLTVFFMFMGHKLQPTVYSRQPRNGAKAFKPVATPGAGTGEGPFSSCSIL